MASPSMHWTFGLPTNPTRTAPGLAGAVEAGEKQKKITVVRGGVDGSFAGTQRWFWIEPLKSKHINCFTMQANEFMVFWQSPGVYFNLNKYVQLSPANQNREKYVRQCSECLHTHLWSYKIDYIYKLAWTARITPCFGRPARLKRKRSWNGPMHRSFQIFSKPRTMQDDSDDSIAEGKAIPHLSSRSTNHTKGAVNRIISAKMVASNKSGWTSEPHSSGGTASKIPWSTEQVNFELWENLAI